MTVDDSTRAIPRLSSAIEALLAHERIIVPQVALTRARALARARAALRAGDVVPLTIPSVAAHHLLYAAAVAITLLVSAAAYQLRRRPVPTAPVDGTSPQFLQRAQVAPPSAVAKPVPPLAADSTPVRAAPTASTRPAKAARLAGPTGLAAKEDIAIEELRLLERALQAAGRGDHATVLTVTTEHERRYPGGRLCEEREALRLRALIGLGRDNEARQAAARFRRDFPRSVLLSKLDEMLVSSR